MTGAATIDRAGIIPSFASIYVNDNSTAQEIATGATYVKLTCFASNGDSAIITPDAANDKITITVAGKYLIQGFFSLSGQSSTVEWWGAAFVDGVEQAPIHWNRIISAGGDVGNVSCGNVITIASAPVDIDFRVRHDDVSAQNLTVTYAALVARFVGF